MKYLSENRYKGEIKGLVLDWSGTTADAYVIAPTIVFVEVFKKQKVVKRKKFSLYHEKFVLFKFVYCQYLQVTNKH